MKFKKAVAVMLIASCGLIAGGKGSRAAYAGGTISQIPNGCSGRIQAGDEQYFVFYANKARWRVPYDSINLLEYGQRVDRRIMAAVLVSPLFLLSRKRQHFLTVGYSDEGGRQQAMIFRVDKGDIRTVLVSLEARTGRKVEFQDEEARKAGKG
jgi:hypothetical protein